jgi:XRE family transcriptional regulator, regulator of sulfur utilization
MVLGNKLKAIRKNLRVLTLSQVSEGTGLSVSFLSDVERGRTKPSLDTLETLAKFYQVNLSEFIVENEQPSLIDVDLMPSGLRELIAEDQNLDKDIIEIMVLMEHQAKKKPVTKEDWKNYYHSLKWMMGR